MMSRSGLLRLAAGAVMTAAALATAAVAGLPAADDAGRGVFKLEGWRRLELAFERPPLASAETVLEIRKGTYEPTGKPAVIFTTSSSATLLGAMGFQEETTSYIDPGSNRPIEFLQLRPGESRRTYAFLGTTIRQTIWEPVRKDAGSDPADWKLVESVEKAPAFSDGTAPSADEWITDFYSLIAILGRLERQSSGPRQFITLYRRHLVRIRVEPGEIRTTDRDLLDEATGRTVKVRLRERRLTIIPLGEGAGSFRGLLGMRGETEFWVEEESGAPVEIAGTAPVIGETRISLRSFLLS